MLHYFMKFSWKIGSVGTIRNIKQHELIEISFKIMRKIISMLKLSHKFVKRLIINDKY